MALKAPRPLEVIGIKGEWQQLEIESVSDGEKQHWPPNPPYRPSSDERYRVVLAKAWAMKLGVQERGNVHLSATFNWRYGSLFRRTTD